MDVTILDTIEKYKTLAKSDKLEDKHAALLFALQLPSICSRIEFPLTDSNKGSDGNDPEILYKNDGTPRDHKLYIKWIVSHKQEFKNLFYINASIREIAENIYSLRNSITHAGVIKDKFKQIVFVENGTRPLLLQNALLIPIKDFCINMFLIAKCSLDEHSSNTLLTDLEISDVEYSSLKEDAYDMYDDFWQKQNRGDKDLYDLYFDLFFFEDESEHDLIREKNGISIETFQNMITIAQKVDEMRAEEMEILKKYGIYK